MEKLIILPAYERARVRNSYQFQAWLGEYVVRSGTICAVCVGGFVVGLIEG